MAEKKDQPPEDPNVARAVKVLRGVLLPRLGVDVYIDVVRHFVTWSSLRRKFTQHMIAWQYLTTLIIAIDAGGNLVGWSIEKRREKGGVAELPPGPAEIIARTDPLVLKSYAFLSVEKVDLEKDNSLAKCLFGPAEGPARLEVSINPATQKLIGVLPVEKPPVKPLPMDDPGAAQAEKLAWKRIESSLTAAAGPKVSGAAKDALKLTLVGGTIDATPYRRFTFKAWTRFSECDVFLDMDSDQTLGWFIEAFQIEAPEIKITAKEAPALAKPELLAKKDVVGPDVSYTKMEKDNAAVVHWQHKIGDIAVAGDFTTVMLNATTGKIFAVSRKWRDVAPEVFTAPPMTGEQALAITDRERNQLSIPVGLKGKAIAQAVVEIADDENNPSPVRNVLVWRVGYSAPNNPNYREYYVDCKTGKIVGTTGY